MTEAERPERPGQAAGNEETARVQSRESPSRPDDTRPRPDRDIEDINLRELLGIILRRRNLIIVIVLVAVLASAAVTFLVQEPTYEAISSVRYVGYQLSMQEGEAVTFEEESGAYKSLAEDDAYWELLAEHPSLAEEGIDLAPAELKEKLERETDNGTLAFTVTGSDPELTALLANAAAATFVDYTVEADRMRMQSIRQNLERRLEENQLLLDDLVAEINRLQAAGSYIGHLEQEVSALGSARAEKKMDLRQVERDVETIGDRAPFAVREEASPAIAPESPRPALNLAVAAIMGLMLGVFAAFFTDYWEKSGIGGSRDNGQDSPIGPRDNEQADPGDSGAPEPGSSPPSTPSPRPSDPGGDAP